MFRIKKIDLAALLIPICTSLYGQNTNLVPNPSFESNNQCPSNTSQLANVNNWINPNALTPDYFNSCDNSLIVGVPTNVCGFEPARTGDAYAGIFVYNLNLREYVQVQLNTPMIGGHRYYVEFYVSLVDRAKYAVSSIGAHISTSSIMGNFDLFGYSPQIINPPGNPLINKNGWTMIADTILASGGEEYITIGNFNTTALSDTLFVGSNSGGWFASYYYIDDVSVIDIDNPLDLANMPEPISILVLPNPTHGEISIIGKVPYGARFQIFDLLGQTVYEKYFESVDVSLKMYLNLPSGIYGFRIEAKGVAPKSGKIVFTH